MKFFGWLMFAGGGVVAFFGVVLLLVQAGMWLKDGTWTPMVASLFWSKKFSSGWVGLDHLLNSDFPAGVFLFLIGMVVLNLGLKAVEAR